MLILTRKCGESIQIGSNITIKVTSIGRGRVQIGIEAPPEVTIRRSELQPADAKQMFPTVIAVENMVTT
ncbi:MAG: carbon storage regulator [Planctomycetales bacterium]|nr:carbon storage regulator [Planctomycetales bacterium]